MPYNIQLPDGTLVENIPDEITPEAAKKKILASRPDLAGAPTEDTGYFDMLGRAVTRGAKQTGSLLGDVLPAMAARAVGADEYAARQMAEAEETQKEIAQKYGARYGELADVKGVGDFLPFASEVIAEQIPNIATALIPGVGGAALGGRMAAQEAAKRLAAREATEAGARYAAMKTAQGQVVGGGVGSFLGSYALNAPEVFQNIFEETGQMEPGAAALAGSVSAALDAILPAYLVRQFTPGMKAGVVEKILERSGMPPGIARQATAGVVTGAVTEGPTEAAQEAISIIAEKFVDENAESWGSKEFNRLVESGVRGAVGGGGISGIAGGGKGYLEKRAAARAQRDLEEATRSKEKTAFDEIDEDGEVITPPPPIDKDEDIPLDLTPPAEVTLDEAEMQQLQATVTDIQTRLGRKLSADELENLYNGFVREKIKRQTPEDLFDEAGLGTKVDTGAVERGVSMPSGAGAVLGAGTGVEGAGQPVVGGAGGVPSGTREGEGRVGAPLGGQILPAGVSDEDRRAFLEEFGVRDYTQPRFTSLTPKEQEVTQQDLIDAGIDAGKANYFIRQKNSSNGKKVNAEAKEAFALAAARKEGGQELLFAAPRGEQLGFDLVPPEEGAAYTPVESAVPFPKERPQAELELAPLEEGAERGAPPPIEREFELARTEGKVEKVSPEMERLVDVDNFLDEVQEFSGPAVATPAQRQQNASLLREFFERVESVANPEAVAQALSYPNSRGARQRIEALAETEDLKALRTALKEFANEKATQGLGYGPERSAFSRIDAGFGAPEGRIVTVLRLLRSLKASERNPAEKAAANYFSTFNYNIAMKSAAFDLANNIPEGDIVKGQGGKTADLFRQYIEENFPAEEYAKFESLVDAYRTNLRKAATALERYSKKQTKVAAVAKVEGMSTAEVERHISRMPLRSGKQAEFKPLHPYIEERIKANDLNGALAFMARLGKDTFNGSIASRLLDLNLPTTISFDRQQEFFNTMVNAVRPELQMFGKYLQDTYPDLYAKYLEGSTDFEIATGLEKIKNEKLLPDYVLENTAYKRLFDTYQNGITALISDGFFSPDGDAININRMFGGGTYYTFLHETIHAATAYQIRNRDALNPDQRKALNELEELYQLAQKEVKVDEYGLTNLDEFIAEAFTSPSFQDQLRAIKYKEKGGSLWNRFMQAVLKLLGGARDNALFSTLYNADILMSGARATPKQGQFAGTLLNAKAPKVAKSTTAGTFKTAPDAPDQKRNKAWLESIMKRANWSAVKENMPQWLENLDDTARKYYLGAFTLRQLKDLAGEKIPQLGRFIDSVEAMLDERNTILQTVSDITKKWETYQSKNPEQTKKMNLVMIDATLAGVDPDTQPGANADLDQRWNELDDDAKAIYREVRDFYEARLKAYRGTILKNVELSMIADNKTPEEITATLTELQTRFDANTKRPYFPLKRFGRYWVAVKESNKVTGFYMFESAGARNTFARDLKASAKPNEVISTGNDISNLVTENIQDLQALKGIKEIVDKATENDNTDLKTAIKESLDQMYLLTLPDKSARKMFINRKEISGASADMLRAFTTSSFHMAYQHSRFKHARAMYQQIAAARAMLTPDMPDVDARVARDYIMELEQRLQYVMNPTDTGLIPSTLSNISFVWYLTAPASALVNMMGVPAIGLPVVSARYGWGNTSATMTAYAKRFLKTGFKKTELGLEAPTLERGDLDDLERRAYDRFVKDGLIDVTLSHDLAGMAEAPTNLYTGRTHKAMRVLSYMFHNAEKFNREVVAMATFRMAYDKAKKDGFTDEAAFDKAVDDSKDLTYRSMFDYSTLNKPRYFQNSYAKVILQFKQFSQQMTYLLARSVYEMTANEDPAVRKEARDRLLGTLGMTFLFAGATGMPLFSIGAATIEAVHAAFSDDDEPPLDFENWFKNWMAENFGSFMGDSISRGVVTQASGLNFADRMSLNDLWFRDVRKSQDEVTALQNMFINLLGPTAGLAISGAEAFKLYNDGLYYRAAEKALPAFLKQPLVGARYMTEGALTTKGDTLIEDISGKDALGQMLGFAPEKVAQKQKANIEMKTEEQRILNERQDLLNAFFMSIDTSDDKLYDRVLDKIANFNNKYPEVAIMGSTLSRSVKERYRRRSLGEATGGISIDKRLIGSLGDMGAYGEPD